MCDHWEFRQWQSRCNCLQWTPCHLPSMKVAKSKCPKHSIDNCQREANIMRKDWAAQTSGFEIISLSAPDRAGQGGLCIICKFLRSQWKVKWLFSDKNGQIADYNRPRHWSWEIYFTYWVSTWEYILGSRCLKEKERDEEFRWRHGQGVQEPGVS